MLSAGRLFDLGHLERLFHGTIEPLAGPLRPGGYDGVFWTAESSAVAQCYIPATGGSTFASIGRYELDQTVRPSSANPFYTVAKMIGPPARNIELDSLGRPRAWSIPDGYATYRRAIEHIEGPLGYKNRSVAGDFTFELLTDGWDRQTQEHIIVPADFRKLGSLVIVDGFQDMRLLDLSRGEGDLGDLQYHKLHSFRAAEAAGYDGVVIDDFCQSKTWGNVGHRSVGFFANAMTRLCTTIIPACRFDWSADSAAGLNATDSPEFVDWMACEESMGQAVPRDAG